MTQHSSTRKHVEKNDRVKSVAAVFGDVRQYALIACSFWWWNRLMNGLQ